ncbi:lmo0937 family membrane protein [Portibacter marinus]|uniref:lmo0937 family membrane protein n=1 Tax=Portibacter marinus TaxID=2898660 RepID=UPI0038732EC2
MRSILNIVIVVLLLAWLLGYIGFGAAVGNIIHILLVFLVIAIILRLVAKV